MTIKLYLKENKSIKGEFKISVKIYTGIKIFDIELFLSELRQLKKKLVRRDLISNKNKLTELEEELMFMVEEETQTTDYEEIGNKLGEYYRKYIKGEYKFPSYVEDNLKITIYDNGLGVVIGYSPNIEGTYLDLILNFESVEEYAYFDNVDKLEEIKDWEWEMRKIAWEKAIGKSDDISTEFEERLVIDVYEERLTLQRVIDLIELYKKED